MNEELSTCLQRGASAPGGHPAVRDHVLGANGQMAEVGSPGEAGLPVRPSLSPTLGAAREAVTVTGTFRATK